MAEASPGARPVGIGVLKGYGLAFNLYSERWHGGAVNLELDPRSRTWGVVWEVPDAEAPGLDTYTGHPTFHRQELVPVHVAGERVECVTHRVAYQGGFVPPSDAYVNLLRSAMRRHGFPPEALDALEAAAETPSRGIEQVSRRPRPRRR